MIDSNTRHRVLHKLQDLFTHPDDWQSSLAGTGPVYELEEKFKRLTGHRYALGMCNATLALWQIFEALDIHQREVICSPITWGGMLTGALLAHNELIFSDVDLHSLNATAHTIRPLIGKRTGALLLNDTFGYPGVGPELRELAGRKGLLIIQDCSTGFGAWICGQHTGAYADVAVYSLGPGKVLSASEGAVVVTSNEHLFERLVEHTQHPQRIRRDVPWKINQLALNCRISAVGAAIASACFYPALKSVIRRRSHWQQVLRSLNSAGLSETPLPPAEILPAYSTFTFTPAGNKERELFCWLTQKDSPLRIIPAPVCRPLYQDAYFKQHYPQKELPHCPVAEAQCARRIGLVISD